MTLLYLVPGTPNVRKYNNNFDIHNSIKHWLHLRTEWHMLTLQLVSFAILFFLSRRQHVVHTV